MTMERHHVAFDPPWWTVVGMLAQARCTNHSAVMRDALAHFARAHGITVVDGEVVHGDPQQWAESTAEEEIHGGGESTGEEAGADPRRGTRTTHIGGWV